MPGTDWKGFVLKGHSGLSLGTHMSPSQVLDILLFAQDKRYGRIAYAELLKPYRLSFWARPTGPYSVRAKSGTIPYVRSQAGYITTSNGRALTFALIIHDVAMKKGSATKIGGNRIRNLAQYGWMVRARKLEHDLIAHWVRTY